MILGRFGVELVLEIRRNLGAWPGPALVGLVRISLRLRSMIHYLGSYYFHAIRLVVPWVS
jgi:hypothetical protein